MMYLLKMMEIRDPLFDAVQMVFHVFYLRYVGPPNENPKESLADTGVMVFIGDLW